MIPGKESLVFFEKLAETQERIYPDACDYGITISSPDFPEKLKNEIKYHAENLKEIYKHERKEWKDRSGKIVSINMNIPFEMEGKYYLGVTLSLGYHSDKRLKKKFVTMDFSRFRSTESSFNPI